MGSCRAAARRPGRIARTGAPRRCTAARSSAPPAGAGFSPAGRACNMASANSPYTSSWNCACAAFRPGPARTSHTHTASPRTRRDRPVNRVAVLDQGVVFNSQPYCTLPFGIQPAVFGQISYPTARRTGRSSAKRCKGRRRQISLRVAVSHFTRGRGSGRAERWGRPGLVLPYQRRMHQRVRERDDGVSGTLLHANNGPRPLRGAP